MHIRAAQAVWEGSRWGRPGPRCGERRGVRGCGRTRCLVARSQELVRAESSQLVALRESSVGLLEPFSPSVARSLSLLASHCSPLPAGSDAGLVAFKVPAAQPEPHAFIPRLSAAEVRSDWPSREPGPRAPLLERGEGEEAARVTVRKRVSL